ncbi:transposase [Wohlfahrtiimonas chitiniclastica]|nr:transposase [Wohlfahrtiimonas chitiniclastica]
MTLKPIFLDLNIYDKPNLRNIFEGILFRMRIGCPWRDIPIYFGASNSIFKAFSRWPKNNKLMKLFKKLSKNVDYEWLFMDGTHIRAHQHSSGAASKIDYKTSAKAVIPKKRNTKANNDHMDWYIYKISHLVENAFARLKHFRGIATRYDKLKRHYENTVALACTYIWLKL